MDKIVIVSRAQLYRKLAPYCHGWGWATDAIDDLWKLGAPVPRRSSREPVKRIILPSQFKKWWREVAERNGDPDADSKLVYRQIG